MTSVLAWEPTPASYFGKGRAGCVVKRLQMLLCAPRGAPSAGAAGQGCCQRRGCGGGAAWGSLLHPTALGAIPRGDGSPGSPSRAWVVLDAWIQPLRRRGEGDPRHSPAATTSLCHTRWGVLGTDSGSCVGGTWGAWLVTRTWWHLKVTGKGKETETWRLPWLPPSIHQRWLQAHVTPVFNHRDGL